MPLERLQAIIALQKNTARGVAVSYKYRLY